MRRVKVRILIRILVSQMNLKQGGELRVFSQENIENELCHLSLFWKFLMLHSTMFSPDGYC